MKLKKIKCECGKTLKWKIIKGKKRKQKVLYCECGLPRPVMVKTKPKKKRLNKHERIEKRMENDSQKAIKRCSCKRCGGIIVTSYATSLMALQRKRCNCKKPLK